MAAIDAYLFGYRTLYPEEGGESRLATALVKLGIVAEGRQDGGFLIREADFTAFKRYAAGRVRYRATELCGLPSLLLGLRSRIPQLVAVILSIFLVIFLSRTVWDVRIEGAEAISTEAVEQRLAEAGLSVGRMWNKIDAERVETALLDSAPELAWVQINRRGTVAEVIIRERARGEEQPPPPYAASNIVASADGVIEEITVKRGTACVKVGDVVKAGDILISGVVEGERGSYITSAEGSVRAHVAGRISASASERETESTVEDGGLESLAVSIFGLKINIFKNYGNSDTDCVIIENEVEYLYLFGKRLPLAITRNRRQVRTEHELSHGISELPALAGARLDAALAGTVGAADLIKLKTSGGYTDGGYVLVAEYVISREIGEVRRLTVE